METMEEFSGNGEQWYNSTSSMNGDMVSSEWSDLKAEIENKSQSMNGEKRSIYFSEELLKLKRNNANMISEFLNSFVIEMTESPSRIIKKPPKDNTTKPTAFKAELHIKLSYSVFSSIKCSVYCVREDDMYSDSLNSDDCCGSACGVPQKTTGYFLIQLKKLYCKTADTCKSESDSSVIDKKYCLVFLFQLNLIKGGEIIHHILRFGPVTLNSHTNQNLRAKCVLWWDDYFPKPNRIFYYVRPSAFIDELLIAIENYLTNEKLIFSHLHRTYIRNRLTAISQVEITYDVFLRDLLPWIIQSTELIVNFFTDLWNDELIHGFISKRDTEHMLKSKCCGTFLLRFSDTCSGNVSVSVVDGARIVQHWKPFTPKELSEKDLISHLLHWNQQLLYLCDHGLLSSLTKYCKLYVSNVPPGYVPPGPTHFAPLYSTEIELTDYPME